MVIRLFILFMLVSLPCHAKDEAVCLRKGIELFTVKNASLYPNRYYGRCDEVIIKNNYKQYSIKGNVKQIIKEKRR